MNAEEYLNLMTHLNTSVVDDPRALLALTVAWLDPLAILEDLDDLVETDLGEFYDSGDEMGVAIRVARDCFPGIYAESISKIRDGARYQQAVEFIGTQIREQTGIPIDQYEEPIAYAFGIPLPFYGVAWEDPYFIEDHPELTDLALLLGATREERYAGEIIDLSTRTYQVAHILQCSLWADYDKDLHRIIMWAIGVCTSATGNSSCLCGIDISKSSAELNPTQIELPEEAYIAGRLIAESLETHEDKRYQQVSWLFKWLFSCSNNSCVDWTAEEMYSVEPLAWTSEDVAFAIEIIQEADTIMADAMAGLRWLLSESVVLFALWHNVQRIYQSLSKQPKRQQQVKLTWPELPTSGQTIPFTFSCALSELGCPLAQSS